jgi:hypothetical protein
MRDPKQAVGRRGMLAGAGTLGALTAVAALLPKGVQPEPQASVAAAPPVDGAGGYRLTEHVKRYYQTAKI